MSHSTFNFACVHWS